MDINSQDEEGNTPLHYAYMMKNEYAINYILAMDPQVNL